MGANGTWEESVAEPFKTILIERGAEGVTFVILSRPEKRNAMSPQLHREMCEALDALETEDATKIVVLTGAGESFSAGQDIKLYFRSTEDDPKARAAHLLQGQLGCRKNRGGAAVEKGQKGARALGAVGLDAAALAGLFGASERRTDDLVRRHPLASRFEPGLDARELQQVG